MGSGVARSIFFFAVLRLVAGTKFLQLILQFWLWSNLNFCRKVCHYSEFYSRGIYLMFAVTVMVFKVNLTVLAFKLSQFPTI